MLGKKQVITCIFTFLLQKICILSSKTYFAWTFKQNMKKNLLKLICISTIVFGNIFSSNAQVVTQGSKHVHLGLGFPNFPGLIFTALGGGGGSSFGPLLTTFEYGVADKIAIGGTFGYSTASSPSLDGFDANGNNKSYTLNLNLLTIMARATYHYSNSDKADFYSGISLGYANASVGISEGSIINTVSYASVGGFAYQFTPIGFRYMFTDNIGAHTELGYGLNGLAQIGLSAKF